MVLAHEGWAWGSAQPVLVGAFVAVAFFAQGFVRLRRRGRSDHAPAWRAVVFGAAVAIGLLALVSPLDTVGEDDLLSAHMLQHMLIGDLVPVLLLVALRGPLLFFFLPAAMLGALSGLRPLRAVLAFALLPLVSLVLWMAALAVWHIPALYDGVLARPLVHDLEHATFFVAGLLVWAQLVDPARRRALTPSLKLGYALLLFACGTALANVLLLREGALYPAYAGPGERPLGFGPLGDQRAAAGVMMLEQLITLGTFTALALRARSREPIVLAADRHPLAT